MLQWTLGYTCLFELWFSQGICQVVGLLGHMVILSLIFKGISTLLSTVVYQFTFPPTVQEGSVFPHRLQHLLFVGFFFFFFDDGHSYRRDFPGGASGKEPTCKCRRHKKPRFYPCLGNIPWSRKWQPTPVFLSWKSHGQRKLLGYVTVHWVTELDVTEATEHIYSPQ